MSEHGTTQGFPPIPVVALRPSDPISGLEERTVGDFWSWAYSDLVSNRNRAVLAEFLVGCALGLADVPRVEWDAVDFRYRGRGVEVKSAAYHQSWAQTRLSEIRFGIAPRRPWDPQTNTYGASGERSADIYVFCLYPELDRRRINVLNVEAWLFFVLSRGQIEQRFGAQKAVGFAALERLCRPVRHTALRAAVDEIIRSA